MRRVAFENARVLDPAAGVDEPGTVLVRAGVVEGRLRPGDPVPSDAERRDCAGLVLAPGLVDSCARSGEPGGDHRETLRTLGDAAVAGGVTTLLVQPDTDPVIDTPAMVSHLIEAGRHECAARIAPVGALTAGLAGEALAEMGLMLEAGAVAFGQASRPIASAAVLRRAMLYARDLGRTIDLPPRDASLAGGAAASGSWGAWLGLSSMPPEAETIGLLRDAELARATGARLHVSTVSCERSLAHLRRFKDEADVTAGVAINHLSLNETDIGGYRTFLRLDPPLRSEEDRRAMVEGLADGTIDMICSDHDPQDADTKRLPFADAATGAIGLETLLAAALRLHHSGDVPLARLIEALTAAPARRFGLDTGTLRVGVPADIVLFDPDEPWVVREEDIRSRSKNTAFERARMMGRVRETWVGGRLAFALQREGE